MTDVDLTETGAWRHITTGDDFAAAVVALYARRGNQRYDEAVTQTEHAVQCAELAREAGADDSLVCAALLHDLGHLLLGDQEHSSHNAERDLHHEDVAARFLIRWFDPAVTEPIRLHVAAKRYLCAVEPGYFDGLSPASVASLAKQGGPFTAEEADAYAATDGSPAAADLRRWDDLAKDPEARSPAIASYAPLIAGLVTVRGFQATLPHPKPTNR